MREPSQSSRCSHESDFRASLERDLPTTIPQLLASLGHEATELRHVGSGLSHVVFSFKTPVAAELDSFAMVIRVQIFPQDSTTKSTMTSHAATLRMLARFLPSVPRFSHMDFTDENAVKRPYIITTFLTGCPLDDVGEHLLLDEEIDMCKTVARELHSFRNIMFSATGPLEACLEGCQDVQIGRFQDNHQALPALEGPNQGLKDWLAVLLKWRADMAGKAEAQLQHIPELLEMLQEMDQMDYFSDIDVLHRTILSHPDLHGGNILVVKTPENQWNVSGILDWDEAYALPPVIAARSLEWMWSGALYDDNDLLATWTGDLDFVSESSMDALPPDRQQLKLSIDTYMAGKDPSYMEDVYGRGRWIRRIAKFALFGWSDNREFTMTEWLLEEWVRHKLKGPSSRGAEISTGAMFAA